MTDSTTRVLALVTGASSGLELARRFAGNGFDAVVNAEDARLGGAADSGVTITSLMPGPTETDFFHRADMDDNTRVGASSSKPARSRSTGSTS